MFRHLVVQHTRLILARTTSWTHQYPTIAGGRSCLRGTLSLTKSRYLVSESRGLRTDSGLICVVKGVVHLGSAGPLGCPPWSLPQPRLTLTNRVIRDVLPTLCSPRKTSLNFLSGDEAVNSPDAGVGVDMALGLGRCRVPEIVLRSDSSQSRPFCSC